MTDDNNQQSAIQPASFQPPEQRPAQPGKRIPLWQIVLGACAFLLVYGLWFVLTARSITIAIEPVPEQMDIAGGLVIELGGNYLLRPGEYRLTATKTGYHNLQQTLRVAPDSDSPFRFSLTKLPGLLTLSSEPTGASVSLDAQRLGETPLADYELESGEYSYHVSAPRYQAAQGSVLVEGLGRRQRLHVALEPLWAEVTIVSQPSGATVFVDDLEVGETGDAGFVAEIMPGKHSIRLSLDGYKDWRHAVVISSNEARALPPVKLQKLYGKVRVSSRPTGARVLVDGEYRGLAPLNIELRPGDPSTVSLAKAGYRSASKTLTLESGEERELALTLEPMVAEIRVRAEPADALLYIDGILRGRANQTIQLTTAQHQLEIRKAGYASHRQTITPRADYQQEVRVTLLTEHEAFLAQFDKEIETSTGDRLRLVEPGSFTMGSPRREQGRQANEVQRDIKLTRLFYIGTREVTNAAFRQFRAAHSSGIVQRTSLDNDNYPVARVSWNDAVAFCNWLSQRDGLPPAYRNGKLIQPATTGYRLPTEAEWAWVARYSGGREERKYPWGNDMPPAKNAGNYADVSAQGIVNKTLSEYHDGYAAAAPVGRFAANPLGIYDLGGNVSEWVNDILSTDIPTAVEVDPMGVGEGELHVIRGSSWRHGRITELRVVYRDSGADGRDDVGFRVARYAR